MVEPGGEAHLAAEAVEQLLVDEVGVRDLERDAHAFDRVLRAVHLGEAALRDAQLDAVLAQHLARAQAGAHERRSPRDGLRHPRHLTPRQPNLLGPGIVYAAP